ncbi:uncharacterized protein YlxW (UPF0749 family) [Saonia flava]|uniref:Uncharacterized protein YlxW (UPF0749 family) n=1 Tax=Saonia flava TaxID=523696 RepID=A0A846QVH2_9FLAO|nr:hypothetical protein [Saonia flava]NJB71227.1 uncharacterized protein YlxW (UPF0749 family) [Saonia flava]
MEAQDSKFNYKIILAALAAVIVGIIIAFYYSYAQSQTQIDFLEQEKGLLVKDLTLMRAQVDQLSARNEVNEIELESSRHRIQQLLDSVGRINFNTAKLRENRKELRALEAKYDSLKLKNNFLTYNNMLLSEKYEETRTRIQELRNQRSSLAQAEADQRKKIQELNNELRTKSYLNLENAEGMGFRVRSSRPIRTNKASTIEKLRGCVTIVGNPNVSREDKVVYFQFLGPNMNVIEDNANTISVNGNIYSKRIEVVFMGDQVDICDFITIPEGSLQEGLYTLNVFEDERLLSTNQFELK